MRTLMTFVPPAKAAKKKNDLIAQLRDELARDANVQRPWTLKLQHPDLRASPVQAWVEDEHFELDYHVRRSALPSPGDERELGILVSRLHGAPLDFHRPPSECHFIEGLEGDRIAIYFEVHHSLIDGYTGMRMLVRSPFERSERARRADVLRTSADREREARRRARSALRARRMRRP